MKLKEFIEPFDGGACISIDGYCEEERYDYFAIPLDEWGNEDKDALSGNNSNHYVPTCLAKESWWDEVKDKNVLRWCVFFDETPQVGLFIELD